MHALGRGRPVDGVGRSGRQVVVQNRFQREDKAAFGLWSGEKGSTMESVPVTKLFGGKVAPIEIAARPVMAFPVLKRVVDLGIVARSVQRTSSNQLRKEIKRGSLPSR